jgi:hypothetical protein
MNEMANGLWMREFGADYDVPQLFMDAPDLVDVSWHNDVSPSFMLKGTEGIDSDQTPRIWIEHPDPRQREYPATDGDPRFLVTAGDSEYDRYETAEQALAAFRQLFIPR